MPEKIDYRFLKQFLEFREFQAPKREDSGDLKEDDDFIHEIPEEAVMKGIDGTIKEDKLGLDIIYIQAKRWQQGSTVPRFDQYMSMGDSTPESKRYPLLQLIANNPKHLNYSCG